MSAEIAVVGMACRYADAASPQELWETVVAQRQAFRRLPPERLRLEDYLGDPADPDAIYSTRAAVLEGWAFDRVRFRVGGDAYRAADVAHWLALEVAADALVDAGFPDGDGLPRETTGVRVGNSLTGEFSRAGTLRLRWPYVRRTVASALAGEGLGGNVAAGVLARLEEVFKAPFPAMNDESLAGGLANTIAGRIANHFDLGGGGYTVDGACASSLLALCDSCADLAAGDLDVAVAGGVDLSIDPFELVGFARTGALTPDGMWVFDERSRGFVPGEGCGVMVLMRRADAEAAGRRIYATIRGWGVSSDGAGGLTRPSAEGQVLALARAYRRAGCGIEEVSSFEGHGTGTAVGDATELAALAAARRQAGATAPAWVGSVKANIGHTKAASGAAGAIKAALSIFHRQIPPHTGGGRPHRGLCEGLRLADEAVPWPADRPLRAGVSGMGFGGINAHLVLAAPDGAGRAAASRAAAAYSPAPGSAQGAELFVLGAGDAAALGEEVAHLRRLAPGLASCELTDLAAALAAEAGAAEPRNRPWRAAVVAADPEALTAALDALAAALERGEELFDPRRGIFLGNGGGRAPRLGLLFPGQGAPMPVAGGPWRRRFPGLAAPFERLPATAPAELAGTGAAQLALAAAAVVGLRALERLGLEATVAVGHSVGELAALCWAGCFDEEALLRLAGERGRAMEELAAPGGAMAALAAPPERVDELLAGLPVAKAALNGPEQTVVSGPAAAVDEAVARARAAGVVGRRLPVAAAFHSPLVAAAAPRFAAVLAGEALGRPLRRVVSTVTGEELSGDDDLAALLVRQITDPVLFSAAFARAATDVDLWIEVGPGTTLSTLAGRAGASAVGLDVGGERLTGLLSVAAAAFAAGTPVALAPLFADRFSRPFDRHRPRRFLANPCEEAPLPQAAALGPAAPGLAAGDGAGRTAAVHDAAAHDAAARDGAVPAAAVPAAATATELPSVPEQAADPLATVLALAAERNELPPEAVLPEHRLLSDLHLSSLAAGQLVADAAARLGVSASLAPLEYADASLAEIAGALAGRQPAGSGAAATAAAPPGVAAWVRAFTVDWVERERPQRPPPQTAPSRTPRLLADPAHPLRQALEQALAARPGAGRVVALPAEPGPAMVDALLDAARQALAAPEDALVVVQHGGGGSGFARSLHLEAPWLPVAVVDVPYDDPRAAEWVAAEAVALAEGFREVRYDGEGGRREPLLRRLPPADDGGELPLGPDDVLLVSGGSRGIGARCARALSAESGVRLALLGRSDPGRDPALAAWLDELAAAGLTAAYESADVTDPAAVAAAVARLERRLGPVTGLLHAAGVNRPRRVADLDAAEVAATLAPKLDGLANLLAAVDPARLRCLVAFASIIGRSGMDGEAHYALANEWLRRRVEELAKAHPGCRCLALEWSVWSGEGMGESLGVLERLADRGILPIAPAAGTATLSALLRRPPGPAAVVVASRMGEMPTLARERGELPLLRFLEESRVFYPGIELVVDCVVSVDTDPYLADHVYDGARLLPAVVGTEAMVQAATALAGGAVPAVLDAVRFERPVYVPATGGLRLRLAAVAGDEGVEVVLRSEETGFAVDHFAARCRFEERREPALGSAPETAGAADTASAADAAEALALDPRVDLYGGLLFHDGRFRRLSGYRRLSATECLADISADGSVPWFSAFLPDELLLGDPAARDAAIHAVQACIPQATVLPVAVERLELGRLDPTAGWAVAARERARYGDTLIYDLDLIDGGGEVRERWRGLELRVVARRTGPLDLALPLVAPYVERRLAELLPRSGVRLALAPAAAGERPAITDLALAPLVGGGRLCRDGDGRPRVLGSKEPGSPEQGSPQPPAVSAAHAAGLILAVAGAGPLACDLERVGDRGREAWQRLLGGERFVLAEQLARDGVDDEEGAAARVWTALECLHKAGCAAAAPLAVAAAGDDGWAVLRSGGMAVSTLVFRAGGERLALAVLGEV